MRFLYLSSVNPALKNSAVLTLSRLEALRNALCSLKICLTYPKPFMHVLD